MYTDNLVYIVDDDKKVRDGLGRLLESAGYRVTEFDSAESFMSAETENFACMILDVQMPGESGPELQQRLLREGRHLHIVFLSGHADVPTTVQAMKLGAADFLEKPISSQKLLDTVANATKKLKEVRQKAREEGELQLRSIALSKREKQVMGYVAAGMANKEIAAALGLHEQTIKQHRGSVMRKMKAESLADLVRMCIRLRIKADS
jgi:FixJ family two-component response regulator